MEAEVSRAWLPAEAFDHRFIVLRDPADRLLSEYRFRLRERCPQGFAPRALIGRWRVRQNPRRVTVRRPRGGRRWLDADEWALAAMRACRADPYVADNHLRAQSDFWDDGLTAFLFEDGLPCVFGWIDSVTATSPLPMAPHEKPCHAVGGFGAQTLAEIASFYASDYALIERIRSASRSLTRQA